ncbi:hypothetical protein [Sphingobium sp. YR768]|uniref:hypothetical protein n=1 Tax=Sphingobium sp. YR768 TaxID=1884365 RepID=UPI0008CC9155|nr:hypothetical protein [Sphingobium sp. YR768]SES19703.1 hypothetical protein SAMN05518866_1604 [Sphingobium sp. YR768]
MPEITDPALLQQLNAGASAQPSAPQSFTIGTPDPMRATERQLGIQRDQQQIGISGANAQRDADKAARDRREWEATHGPDGTPRATLPSGYQFGPDGRTAMRVPGLPPEAGATGPQTDADRQSVRAEALDKIRLARSLQQRSRDGWFTTGFGSGVAGSIRGTGAYDVAQDTETLKNAGALTRIMEMARTNGGKNPLTPLSNSDFQALASSLSNLDTGQGDEQYQANVQRVIDLYTRAYQGAGGADLERDLAPPGLSTGAPAAPPVGGGTGGGGAGSNPGTLVPTDVANAIKKGGLSDAQAAAYDAFMRANPNANADQLRSFAQSMGLSLSNAEDIIRARDAGGGYMPGETGIIRAPDISDVRGQGGVAEGADAFVRGAADTASLGFADELTAAGDTLFGGGTMDDNLARQRAIDAYDAENSPWLRGGGQLAGGLVLPIGRVATAGDATKVGAAYGGAYGFGSGEGVGDRLMGAGTGAVTGGVLGAGLQRVGNAIGSRLGRGRAGNPDARAVYEAAQRQGIDLLPADIGGDMTRRMTAGAVQTPLGAGPILNSARRAQQQAAGVVDRAASAVTQPADQYGAGRAAQRGAERFVSDSEKRAGRLYDAISVPDRMPAVTSASTRALGEITQGMESNPELSRIWTGHPRLRATLEALTPNDTRQAGQVRLTMETEKVRGAHRDLMDAENTLSELQPSSILPGNPRQAEIAAAQARVNQARDRLASARELQDQAYVEANQPPTGGGLSWADMKRLRSTIGEIIGKPSFGSEGNEIAANRAFYAALSEDMRATAERAGPEALRQFERANGYWRGRQDRIANVVAPILGKEGGADGQAAFNAIQNWAGTRGESSRVGRLMRSIPKDEAETIGATFISELGKPGPGRLSQQNQFSLSDFATHWNKMDPKAKSALFTSEQRAALNDLFTVASGTKEAQRFANTSNTAGALASHGTTVSTVAGVGALATGQPLAALAAFAPAIGQYVTGRMLASPKFVERLASAAKARTPTAQSARLQALSNLIARDPALAQEGLGLQQYIAKVANDNAGGVLSSAANDKQNKQNEGSRRDLPGSAR